jgi:hypothetical protein
VTAPTKTRTESGFLPAHARPGASRARMTSTIAGFAVPPILTSSAISPASAAVRGPQVPMSSGGRFPGKG